MPNYNTHKNIIEDSRNIFIKALLITLKKERLYHKINSSYVIKEKLKRLIKITCYDNYYSLSFLFSFLKNCLIENECTQRRILKKYLNNILPILKIVYYNMFEYAISYYDVGIINKKRKKICDLFKKHIEDITLLGDVRELIDYPSFFDVDYFCNLIKKELKYEIKRIELIKLAKIYQKTFSTTDIRTFISTTPT